MVCHINLNGDVCWGCCRFKWSRQPKKQQCNSFLMGKEQVTIPRKVSLNLWLENHYRHTNTDKWKRKMSDSFYLCNPLTNSVSKTHARVGVCRFVYRSTFAFEKQYLSLASKPAPQKLKVRLNDTNSKRGRKIRSRCTPTEGANCVLVYVLSRFSSLKLSHYNLCSWQSAKK